MCIRDSKYAPEKIIEVERVVVVGQGVGDKAQPNVLGTTTATTTDDLDNTESETEPEADKVWGIKADEIEEKIKNNEPLDLEDIMLLSDTNHLSDYFPDVYDRLNNIKQTRDDRFDLVTALNISPDQISLTKEEALSGGILFHLGGLYLQGLTNTEGLELPMEISKDLNLSDITTAKGLRLPTKIHGSLYLDSLTDTEGLKLPTQVYYLNLKSLTSDKALELGLLPKTYRPHLDDGNVFKGTTTTPIYNSLRLKDTNCRFSSGILNCRGR